MRHDYRSTSLHQLLDHAGYRKKSQQCVCQASASLPPSVPRTIRDVLPCSKKPEGSAACIDPSSAAHRIACIPSGREKATRKNSTQRQRRKKKKGESNTTARTVGNSSTHTSRHLPNASPADAERCFRHLHGDPARMHEENHLHLARVLAFLEAARRQVDHAAAEEGQGHDLGVAKVCRGNVAGVDGGRSVGNV
jgi:hypothetical protein